MPTGEMVDMSYEIISTTLGPIIVKDGEHLSVHDIQGLLAIAESDDTLMPKLEEHISENLRSAVEEIIDGFKHGMATPNQKIHSYLNSVNITNNFKHQHLIPFMRAVEEIKSQQQNG